MLRGSFKRIISDLYQGGLMFEFFLASVDQRLGLVFSCWNMTCWRSGRSYSTIEWICKKYHRLVESLGFSASQPHDKFPFKDLYIIVQPLFSSGYTNAPWLFWPSFPHPSGSLGRQHAAAKVPWILKDFDHHGHEWMTCLFRWKLWFSKKYLGQFFAARDDVLSRFLEPPI